MPGRRHKLSSFKHNKIIYCIMDAIIILLGLGFVFKLSETNSLIEQIIAIPIDQITCQLCKTTTIKFQDEQCCQQTNNGLCFKLQDKEQCKQQLLSEKNKLALEYKDSLMSICILGTIFFVVECCFESCLSCLLKVINKKIVKREEKSHLKSALISTINFQQSCSSMSSFSSLSQSPGIKGPQRSFSYKGDEMACPMCLETMEGQKVVHLKCKHLMHSTCARISTSCPICS